MATSGMRNRAAPAAATSRRPLLILAAWSPELVRIRQLLRRWKGRQVLTRAVGVGLVEAAAGAARAFAEVKPAQAVLVGTAGVFAGAALRPPQAAWAFEVALGVTEVPDHADLPEPMPRIVTPAARWGAALARAANLPAARVVCPLAITRSLARARKLAQAADAQLENLEAFAVARAAAQAKVPLAVVLGVANTVGPQGHLQWRQHGAAAAAAACEGVWAWLAPGSPERA